VSDATSTAAGAPVTVAPRRGLLPRRGRRWLLAALALLLAGAAAVGVADNPFERAPGSNPGSIDNATSTAVATVLRRPLSSQMQVDGTLGYAGSSSIVLPAGTAPSELQKAQQTVDSARGALATAGTALALDRQALDQAEATLAADRRKLSVDCAGTGAAGGASSDSSGANQGAGSTACATVAQAVTTDQQNVTNAEQKVTTDNGSISTSRTSLSAAEQSLATAESAAVGYDAGAVFTQLPSAGSVVRRGQRLYAIGAQAVLLLYGSTPAWRPFRAGMSPGKDVAELHANLRALGYGKGLAGDSFSAATERAIRSLQAARGLPRTGDLPLGSVVFKAGAVRVTAVLAKLGAAVQAGPVLSVSTTRHQVAIDLDASHQSDVKVGDRVTITLPDTRTTTGVVSAVGRVAAAGSQGSSPTVSVSVTLTHQAAAGRLDQAPVQVSITTSSVDNALVVPVNALLALAGGGYAVEVVGAAGVHRLVAVDLGLFDDAEGLVQVSGTGVHAGQQIVVPST
jgi:hypothetical protein